MAKAFCVFLIILLVSRPLSREDPIELIVWNVGQGQWATIIADNICWHLDMGGEFAPWGEIIGRCRQRLNVISLSHWDMDHIGFAPRAKIHLANLCLLNEPLGEASKHKQTLLRGIPRCPIPSPFSQWANPAGRSANAKSWVVTWRGVLAPGDSPRDQEKTWIHRLTGLSQVHYLILGHHGSRTSTSIELLHALSHLKLAVSSARQQRYGHPHPEVVQELSRAHVPLLRTEEWGSIHLFL
jgi:competence protein ComEC